MGRLKNDAKLKKIDAHIGRQLMAARLCRGFSQSELAAQLGVSFQQLQKYESGANSLAAARLCQLTRILHIEPWFFFDGLHEFEAEPLPLLHNEHRILLRHYNALPKNVRKNALQVIKELNHAAG